MNFKKLALVASLALAFAGAQASAETAGRWEQWLNSYYQRPQPEKVVQAAYGLSNEGYFDQQGATSTAIGFFGAVFAKNPDKVDAWFADFRQLPRADQRLLASALWYSGNPKGYAELNRLAAKASGDTREDVTRLLNSSTPNLAATPVLSDSSMNLQWGAFLATGSEQHVTPILAAVGQGQLGNSARTALAFNAAQHDRVLEICRTQLDKQPNEVKSLLRAVINDAEAKKQQPAI